MDSYSGGGKGLVIGIIVVVVILIIGGAVFMSGGNNSGAGGNNSGAPAAPPVEWKDALACEGQPMTITCPVGKTIDVRNVMYGRTDKTTCPHPADSNTSCQLPASNLQKLIDALKGKQTVTTPGLTNAYYGNDPCGGTYKYTKLQYACM